MIKVETFPVGHLATNCYIVTDEKTNRRAIVDPGYKSAELLKKIKKYGTKTFDYILLTHGHFDHIWYTDDLRELTNAKVMISFGDAPFLTDGNKNLSAVFGIRNFPVIVADKALCDRDTFMLGETEFMFINTPGHTAGSGCFISFKDQVIFSGDTLFRLSMGRTDFPSGDDSEMLNSLRKLAALAGDFTVFPGHGESTTLDFERNNNPYVR